MTDSDIRLYLRNEFLAEEARKPDVKIVDELDIAMANARIDVAVLNGHFEGYEIKSERDNLRRLPNQIEAYSKVFDKLSVVTENRHFGHVFKMLPRWVGLYVCSGKPGKIVTQTIRLPEPNPEQRDKFHIANLLWRSELLEIATLYEVPHRKSDRNYILAENIALYINGVDTLSSIVRNTLKKRPDWKLSNQSKL